VDVFLKQLNNLLEIWCVDLGFENPPTMLKKDRFLGSLKDSLRWKVELKKPHSFEVVVEIKKIKEWNMKCLNQQKSPKFEV